jgi:outer membrane biosynthesis protein TonB
MRTVTQGQARAAGLLAAMALHGLLLAMPWAARAPQPERPGSSQPPLQVMLLSEEVGRGTRLMAAPAPVAAEGARSVPQPPPAPPEPAPPEPAPPEPPPSLPDRPALPRTAPDLAPLLVHGAPSGPIHLRLRVAADGQVEEVQVIEASPEDAAFAKGLAELLRQTPHIPARRGGLDVASTKDVRINFSAPA